MAHVFSNCPKCGVGVGPWLIDDDDVQALRIPFCATCRAIQAWLPDIAKAVVDAMTVDTVLSSDGE